MTYIGSTSCGPATFILFRTRVILKPPYPYLRTASLYKALCVPSVEIIMHSFYGSVQSAYIASTLLSGKVIHMQKPQMYSVLGVSCDLESWFQITTVNLDDLKV